MVRKNGIINISVVKYQYDTGTTEKSGRSFH